LLWFAAEGFAAVFEAGGEGRAMALGTGGLILMLVGASLAWDRLPLAWRAQLAASKALRAVVVTLAALGVGGFLWFAVGALTEEISLRAHIGLTAMLLAVGGGLILALWRLEGWTRTVVCWTIASLAWVGLMTGLVTGVALGSIGVGGWLLAIVPPLIAGAVMLAYVRINRAHRV
jgi:hypothetical protein